VIALRPAISVVVPTRNRPSELGRCLDALAEQDLPAERFEVIVVDDGSAEAPAALIDSFSARLPVILVTKPSSGPAAARNAGVQRAASPIVAFTDDDCRPETGWLRALAERIERDPDCLMGGRTLNALPENPYSEASQLLISYLYDYYNRDPERAFFLTSNNFAMRVDRFVAVGGFDERFPLAAGEDRDLCERWRQNGLRLVYAPQAVVRHAHELSLTSFCRQHFNYGRGAFHFHRLRAERTKERSPVEPARFYVDLVRYPVRHGGRHGPLLYAMLLGISQVANAAGFYAESIRHRLRRA